MDIADINARIDDLSERYADRMTTRELREFWWCWDDDAADALAWLEACAARIDTPKPCAACGAPRPAYARYCSACVETRQIVGKSAWNERQKARCKVCGGPRELPTRRLCAPCATPGGR